MTDKERITQYIELNPHRPGAANARIKEFGVAVWALIEYLKYAVHGDIERAAADYDLPREALEAAIAYYEMYPIDIDMRIAANSPDVGNLLDVA